jgi:hypothetical protein
MPSAKSSSVKRSTSKVATKLALPTLMKTINSDTSTIGDRVKAIAAAGGRIVSERAAFRSAIAIVTDPTVSTKMRSQALDAMVQAQFDPVKFAGVRSQFTTAMRKMRDDPDAELRQRAFGIMARHQDRETQELLIEGLLTPEQARLPPEKALQLLSNDPHAGAFDAAKKILAAPPNEAAKQEAMRVLAADTESTAMFEGVLRDVMAPIESRKIAATAFNQLAPEKFISVARDVAINRDDDNEIRTLCLTALSHFGDAATLRQDTELHKCVDELQGKFGQGTGPYKAAAKFKRSFG